MHLTAGDCRTRRHLAGLLLQFVVSALDASEHLISLSLLADEHADKLNPFCLSQRIQFLITKMGYQSDTSLLDGIIATTFRGRDEDHLWISSQHHLCVEVALHTDLHDTTVLHSLEDVLVEEVLRARQSFHYIVGIEDGEVRQLQGRHHNRILNRYANLRISLRHSHIVRMHQGEQIFASLTLMGGAVGDTYQSNICRVANTEPSSILHLDAHYRVLRTIVRSTIGPCALS